MRRNHVGQMVLDSDDIQDHVMKVGHVRDLRDCVTTSALDVPALRRTLDQLAVDIDIQWQAETPESVSQAQFDKDLQKQWLMPQNYRDMDIAQHVVSLCQTPAQRQRVGHELLMYQDRGLMDLLRYLVYLVDVMKTNNIVWGVGRGSSVSSYVLYLLQVHDIDSMFYDLDPGEFLR